jgi:hypothetical protein
VQQKIAASEAQLSNKQRKPALRVKAIRTTLEFSLQDYKQHETVL